MKIFTDDEAKHVVLACDFHRRHANRLSFQTDEDVRQALAEYGVFLQEVGYQSLIDLNARILHRLDALANYEET